METDWFTAEFMPCLIALVGDLAAPSDTSRRRDSARRKSEHHSSLPGSNMAADQHAQPLPGIGRDTRRAALGGDTSAGE
ncbi:uncharacterized protein N7487_009353 [Penicillium crustosum]|uniref:uncharacterized protein n=1 Tax=Penicillium crustosum TaxID=36656 RepID=UPI00238D2591|nr:uncharacterized protein N7487_009353 [Penicillium crustosum]KAJ5395050.1 hypothetical protein N7487_009353 [Penicillium crustosum]